MATLVNTLNMLPHDDAPRQWDKACKTAFSSAKEALTASPMLCKNPVWLATDCFDNYAVVIVSGKYKTKAKLALSTLKRR